MIKKKKLWLKLLLKAVHSVTNRMRPQSSWEHIKLTVDIFINIISYSVVPEYSFLEAGSKLATRTLQFPRRHLLQNSTFDDLISVHPLFSAIPPCQYASASVKHKELFSVATRNNTVQSFVVDRQLILFHIWKALKPNQTTESHRKLSKHARGGRWKSQPDIVYSYPAVILDILGFCRTMLKSKSHSFLGAPCNGERLAFMKPANLPSHQHKLFSFPLWCLAKAHSVCLPLSSSGIVLSTGMPKPRAVL